MKNLGIAAMGAVLLMAATAVSAQAQPSPRVNDSQTLSAPAPVPEPMSPPAGNAPLFMIDNVPVQVWAPMEPHYDGGMNRNLAADPLWTGSGTGVE